MSMSPQQLWEEQNEQYMKIPQPEPRLKVRAKTQLVSQGILRYMGEEWTLPERFALGLVGGGEAEQVIEEQRPVCWQQNAPGPIEHYFGSRENRNPGEQHERQQRGAISATLHQPQLDQTRQYGEPGGSGPGPGDPPPRIPPF